MALDITTRRGWGARTNRTGRPMRTVSKLAVHHYWRPDVPAGASRATERSVTRGVEAFHASKGWSAAPGYTWIVYDSGRVYEGTGWGRAGVHTAGINSISIAFCFGNDGDANEPTPAAWAAMHELQEIAKARGHLTGSYDLSGHRDWAAKSCPGNKTYPLIGRVRSGNIPGIQEDEMFQRDDSGPQVRKGQEWLRTLGYKITVDGDFGPNTEKVVLRFQKDYWLPQTKRLDLFTVSQLAAAVEEKRASTPKEVKA